MRTRLSRLQNWAKILAPFVILSVMTGIIGNRADDAFLRILPLISKPITLSLWSLLFLCLVFFAPSTIISWNFYQAHKVANKLNELDDILLLLLSKLDLNPDPTKGLQLLVDEFLEETLYLFVDARRISVFHRDPSDANYLIIWRSQQVPTETVERTRFYIESPNLNQKPGIAGTVFIEGILRVVHLSKNKQQWVADDPEYICVTKRKRQPYESLVAVPIIGNANEKLGVLCLDSNIKTAFDSEKIQELLRAVCRRLAAAILIANRSS